MIGKPNSKLQSPEQLAERARAIADRWKARLLRETRPAVAAPAKARAPVPDNKLLEDLHEQLAALGTEIARVERELSELRKRNQSIEERAMAAIRDGDDRAAKTRLSRDQSDAPSRCVAMRIHLAGVVLAAVVAGTASAQSPAQPPAPMTPVGVWRGASVCLVRPSACNDEIVVYRITSMKATDSLAVDARKIVRGEEQEMGVLACRLVPLSGQLTCTIPQGVWHFSVRNDSLTGELRLPDNTRYREVRTMRAPKS